MQAVLTIIRSTRIHIFELPFFTRSPGYDANQNTQLRTIKNQGEETHMNQKKEELIYLAS